MQYNSYHQQFSNLLLLSSPGCVLGGRLIGKNAQTERLETLWGSQNVNPEANKSRMKPLLLLLYWKKDTFQSN